jgi:hypothetical protein
MQVRRGDEGVCRSKIDILRDSTGLGTAKFTRPVLIQKLKNDFDLGSGAMPRTPALPGQVPTKGDWQFATTM